MTATAEGPTAGSVRPKSFRFTTSLDWLDGRAGLLRGEGKTPFRVAPPPEFSGEADAWSPEHLFIAAVDTCLLMTFAGLAEKARLQFVTYQSEAEGLLDWVDGGFQFTEVILRPEIIVRHESEIGRAEELLSKAHAACLIAKSLRSSVSIEARIRYVASADAP